jgi:hypothetical protein
MSRTIYYLKVSETEGTLYEIKEDGVLYIKNLCDGIESKELTYYHLVSSLSNEIIRKSPNISPDDWATEYRRECEELIYDIAELPGIYHKKAKEDMDRFAKDFIRLMRKKTKAMMREGVEYDEKTRNPLEGVYIRDGKECCFNCKEPKEKLKRCGRCLNIHYCSPECSRADWARHKPNCVPCR